MVKYTLKRLDKPSAIDVNLFAYQDEMILVTDAAAALLLKLRNLKLIGKSKLDVTKGAPHGLYHYGFKVPCSLKKMNKTEGLIRKEVEDLGLEEKKRGGKLRKA